MLKPWDFDHEELAAFSERLVAARNDREVTETWEGVYLHPLAQRSRGKHRGRVPRDWRKPCPYRTAFQRDVDRIIHCIAFRRLMQKTQAFISPEPDYFRTRLTHTLEVTGFSRGIARALRANEDLAQAIALGHDLGHTPFGHMGEQALQEILGQREADVALSETKAEIAERARNAGISFDHHRQSWLIVTGQDGVVTEPLNLTQQAAYGIVRHSLSRWPEGTEPPETLEEQIVKWADDIAWANHDLNDAMEAGILSYSELGLKSLRRWGSTSRERIDKMLRDIVDTSAERLSDHSGGTVVDGQRTISGSQDLQRELRHLKAILARKVWKNVEVERRNAQARAYIQDLLEHFYLHDDELPIPTQARISAAGSSPEERIRALKDHISGMTDKYVLDRYLEHLGPATPFRCGEGTITEDGRYWQVSGDKSAECVGDEVKANFGKVEGASAEPGEGLYDVYFLREEHRQEPSRFARRARIGRVEVVAREPHSCTVRVVQIRTGSTIKPGHVLLRSAQ